MRNEKRATVPVRLLRFDIEDFADALRDAVWIENAAGGFRKLQQGRANGHSHDEYWAEAHCRDVSHEASLSQRRTVPAVRA